MKKMAAQQYSYLSMLRYAQANNHPIAGDLFAILKKHGYPVSECSMQDVDEKDEAVHEDSHDGQ